ncbi:rhodanese-like domain-containing protein 4, chloroplastic [Impatiens glandulifera]|uniref:rhodanese-like domain-containing protein 4, chloroplastic n=1 Tax=Impatiens glandulifera TaxID=253017 RepID=UPI001FB0F23E|nr:rhodanese-like domain-containing protein 4, chloroplastic [Impatiens glandulifera]
MEAINGLGLTPISVLSDRTRRKEPIKISSLPCSKESKHRFFINLSESASRNINGGMAALLSSIITVADNARALTYEEALRQSETTSDFDFGGLINYAVENSAVIIGGAAILAVPLVLSQILGKSKQKPWGVDTSKNAFEKLGSESNTQLLDIRSPSDIRLVGSPDIRGLKKKTVTVTYNGEDKLGFLKKLSFKFKEPESTTLFILDKFDGNSELVAELLTSNGYKSAYAIKDGAEGPKGWTKSGLPWIEPKKSVGLDFSSLTDAIEGFGEAAGVLSITLGLAVATGLSLFAFTEVETILQVLGSAAIVQFVSKKFLYAEDRKQTLQLVDEFLTTRISPNEIADDIKQIGIALLPPVSVSKALPIVKPSKTQEPEAETEPKPEPETEPKPEPETEAGPKPEPETETWPKPEPETETGPKPEPETETGPKPEPETEPKPEVVSAFKPPKTEETVAVPRIPRSLSPYPYYPDLKPPTSPSPSKP